jgi:sucrose phosphorylase
MVLNSLTGILLPTNSIQPTYSSRFTNIVGLSKEQVLAATTLINNAIAENQDFAVIDFKELHAFKAEILQVVEQKRSYLGQMDVNASSPLVWDFYEETLKA